MTETFNAEDLTKGLRLASEPLRGRVSAIMKMVAEAFEIPSGALLERSRVLRVSLPRQVAMFLIRDFTILTLQDVGAVFSRDHGTVIHAIKAVRGKRSVDPVFDERVAEIARQVRRRFSV